MNRIRKGDEVVVIAGKDKGKRGLVLSVDQDNHKVIVENVNMARRHTKGNPMRGAPGGIIEKEMPFCDLQYCAVEPGGEPAGSRGLPVPGGRPQGPLFQIR